MARFVRECHNCTPQTCNEYESCEDRKAREDWHGKMTAKAAWRLGYITREEFVAIRKAGKLRQIMMER